MREKDIILDKINSMIENIQINNIVYHSSNERKSMMNILVTLKKFINKNFNN